ncbi:MAG: flagellar motor switch protein FliG, partial [Halieaceae bacterium]
MADLDKLSDQAKNEIALLTSIERAAVLLLLLGEEQAANIIAYLSPREVQAIGTSMVAVADLSQETVDYILDEFIMTIRGQTSLGLGTMEYVSSVFNKALGEEKAATVLGRIMPGGASSKGLEMLQWMDARSIGEMIGGEHPQVIAIVMSVLEYDVAADVLNYLPVKIRPEIVKRVANLETIHPNAMAQLEAIMKEQFHSTSAKASSFGGVKTAAKIMNFTKTEMESSIFGGLEEGDPDLALAIMDNMFTFENLSALDNKSIQTLMRSLDQDLLMTAVKGADE